MEKISWTFGLVRSSVRSFFFLENPASYYMKIWSVRSLKNNNNNKEPRDNFTHKLDV